MSRFCQDRAAVSAEYILRKRPLTVARTAGLPIVVVGLFCVIPRALLPHEQASFDTCAHGSCVGWHLHRHHGPSLHYGAHDYFAQTGPSSPSTVEQYSVSLQAAQTFAADQFALLTMTVNSTTVEFYRNLEKLGSRALPRTQVTDCFNGGEGTLVGDAGLELGAVRFYPTLLTITEIEETLSAGGTLQGISSGSEPQEVQDSDVAHLGRTLGDAVSAVTHRLAARQDDSHLNLIVQNAKADAPPAPMRAPAAPLGNMNASQIRDIDSGNRAYYSLAKGPFLLTSTEGLAADQHRTITNVPSFAGTGATVSYWYRHTACASEDCGVYLLVKNSNERKNCWYYIIIYMRSQSCPQFARA